MDTRNNFFFEISAKKNREKNLLETIINKYINKSNLLLLFYI